MGNEKLKHGKLEGKLALWRYPSTKGTVWNLSGTRSGIGSLIELTNQMLENQWSCWANIQLSDPSPFEKQTRLDLDFFPASLLKISNRKSLEGTDLWALNLANGNVHIKAAQAIIREFRCALLEVMNGRADFPFCPDTTSDNGIMLWWPVDAESLKQKPLFTMHYEH